MPDKCVILCGGPSLRREWPRTGEKPGDSVVLAVNEAGAFYAHDWFVAWDTWGALEMFDPKPRVGIACRPRWADERPSVANGAARFALPDMPHFSRNFTLPRAAALVRYLGFQEAQLLGCDWVGTDGVVDDGREGGIRDAGRWAHERRVTEAYCAHYGVIFERYDAASGAWETLG